MNNTSDRRRLAAVVLAGFCAFLDLHAPQPMLPLLAKLFHVTAGQVSLLITASTMGVAIAAPFVGLVADRFGRKRIIVPAAALLAVPTALAATSADLHQLLFWRFLQGVLTPGVFAVTVAYIAEEWPSGAGRAMSAYVSGTVLGGFCGRTLAAIVTEHASWQAAFVVLAALNLAGAAAIWLWLPDGRGFRRAPQEAGQARMILDHLRNPRLLATYAAGFCVMFTLIAAFTYVNFHLAAPPFHLSTAALGLLFTVYLVGVVVTPLAGRQIDRYGHRTTMVVAFGCGIPGMLLTLVPSVAAVMAGLAICCTGVFVAQSAASSYIGAVAGRGRAAAVGLYVTFYYVGGSFGAALPGRAWHDGGCVACVLLIAAVQAFTIALASFFWRPLAQTRTPNAPSTMVQTMAARTRPVINANV